MSFRAACFGSLAAIAASVAFSAEPVVVDALIGRWSRPGVQIRFPEFSPDGTELLLEVRAYETAWQSITDVREKSARHYDPRIGLLRLGDQRFDEIGYGRQARFSPDGAAVIFIAQSKPTTLERIERPEHLEGNYVASYERALRRMHTLTRPDRGFHSLPNLSPDGKRANFLHYVPAAGSNYSVRLSEVDLASRKTRVLYEPPVVDWISGEVMQYGYVQGRLLARLAIPRASPTSFSGPVEFIEQIAEIGDGTAIELFNWGPQDPFVQSKNRLRSLQDGGMIFDGRWRRLSKEGLPGDRVGPVLDPTDDPGRPSPDGRLLARPVTVSNEEGTSRFFAAVVVEEIDTGKVIAKFPIERPKGLRAESIAWSRDSRLLAWPDKATDNWADDHDTLYVARVR